jgi:hypothetical protein
MLEQTKEEYKAMKNAWAKAVNNKENRPYKDEMYGNKIRGKIYSVHYLVYNILRGMPEERGFEPVGQGFKEAQSRLTFLMKYDQDQLLYPFDKTVTNVHLESLR